MDSNLMDKILNFDGLSVAEKITGKSYKEDEKTSMLGFGLSLENNKLKDKMLKSISDSAFHTSLYGYKK